MRWRMVYRFVASQPGLPIKTTTSRLISTALSPVGSWISFTVRHTIIWCHRLQCLHRCEPIFHTFSQSTAVEMCRPCVRRCVERTGCCYVPSCHGQESSSAFQNLTLLSHESVYDFQPNDLSLSRMERIIYHKWQTWWKKQRKRRSMIRLFFQ